ncbi:uncharacterized protein LOC128196131 [Vigna angularis]|uniref:uncharacterized protein LOC128196131 n=1 Tax=Phaseolus angularis TaxID=3914 RepID=UPI0022B4FA75|nr:uncharacterized protein LOC128196131 [Vigna angularis]
MLNDGLQKAVSWSDFGHGRFVEKKTVLRKWNDKAIMQGKSFQGFVRFVVVRGEFFETVLVLLYEHESGVFGNLQEPEGVFILAWERERESSRGKGALPSFRFQPTKEHRGSCTKFRRAERRIGGWVAVDGSVARWPVWRRWSKKGVVMVMEEAGRGEGASPGYGVAGAGHSAWRKPDVVAEFPLEQELEVADVAE